MTEKKRSKSTPKNVLECEGRDLEKTIADLKKQDRHVLRMDVVGLSGWRLYLSEPRLQQNCLAELE